MLIVRKLTGVLASLAIVASGFPSTPVFAQTQVIPISATSTNPVDKSVSIVSTIKAFPNGGKPLRNAIADMIGKDPSLAQDLLDYVKTYPLLTSAQKEAIVSGLTDALNDKRVVALRGGFIVPLVALIAIILGILAYTASQDDDDEVPTRAHKVSNN